MSGIEVAGLVLAAFPIIISALESWRKAGEVYDDWWDMKKEFTKCMQNIECAELELETNLERLLLPLVVDDSDVSALMDEPGGPRWKQPQLEATLRTRLPKGYKQFLDTIDNIRDVMSKLAEELGMEKSLVLSGRGAHSKTSESSRGLLTQLFSKSRHDESSQRPIRGSALSFQKQRAKFAFGRTNRDKLFKDLTMYNDRLKKLLDTSEQSIALKQARESVSKSKAPAAVTDMWRYACQAYDLLVDSFNCNCKDMHCLHLDLLHQKSRFTDLELHFHLIFSHGRHRSHEISGGWTKKTIKAKKVYSNGAPPIIQDQISSKSIPLYSRIPDRPALRSKMKSPSSRSNVIKEPPSQPKIQVQFYENTPKVEDLPLIDNLCSALMASKVDECIGRICDHEAALSLHSILPEFQSTNGAETDLDHSITLDKLLRERTPARLSRKQRYTIALTIASSHLQLFSTPWVSSWSKEAIYFHSSLDQPFLAHSLSPPDPARVNASVSQALQDLGILLTELGWGEALEDQEQRKRYESQLGAAANKEIMNLLDLQLATEWARTMSHEAGQPFALAADWCLRANIESDKIWRKEFWANVVVPLEWSLEQFG